MLILNKMGYTYKDKMKPEKMIIKEDVRDQHEFTLAESLFTRGIQRSQYIAIDNEMIIKNFRDPVRMK